MPEITDIAEKMDIWQDYYSIQSSYTDAIAFLHSAKVTYELHDEYGKVYEYLYVNGLVYDRRFTKRTERKETSVALGEDA